MLSFRTEYEDAIYGGRASATHTLTVRGGGNFPVTIEFASDWWFKEEATESTHLPMKRGVLSLGAVEAQALAVAILQVAADQGPEWASQVMNIDLSGPSYDTVLAQLPKRYVGAIADARAAVMNAITSK